MRRSSTDIFTSGFSAASLIFLRLAKEGTTSISFSFSLLALICCMIASLVENMWKSMASHIFIALGASVSFSSSGSTTMCFLRRDQPLNMVFILLGFIAFSAALARLGLAVGAWGLSTLSTLSTVEDAVVSISMGFGEGGTYTVGMLAGLGSGGDLAKTLVSILCCIMGIASTVGLKQGLVSLVGSVEGGTYTVGLLAGLGSGDDLAKTLVSILCCIMGIASTVGLKQGLVSLVGF
uniref:Uncharacterized protein n=1 Tax=Oncorhynchus mykiss TaxID=8022 RepID=A0A8C7S808_ONCMY